MTDMEEYFGPELYVWILGMPNSMVHQIQDNVSRLMEQLPETPEALDAASRVAWFNLQIAKAFAKQITDGDNLDESDSLWRILASTAVQNVAVMLRVKDILEPSHE